MFRGGRKRPTFDTKVTLIAVNRSNADGGRGYFGSSDSSPEERTFLADVKDIAAREAVISGVEVATRRKSLVFAYETLKDLLEAEESIAKQWKVRIGNREMDITGVMEDWVPNLYARLIVEDRR